MFRLTTKGTPKALNLLTHVCGEEGGGYPPFTQFHIEAETKWLPFFRRHFHFVNNYRPILTTLFMDIPLCICKSILLYSTVFDACEQPYHMYTHVSALLHDYSIVPIQYSTTFSNSDYYWSYDIHIHNSLQINSCPNFYLTVVCIRLRLQPLVRAIKKVASW